MMTGVDDGFTAEEWAARMATLRATLNVMLEDIRPALEEIGQCLLDAAREADDQTDTASGEEGAE